MSLTLGDQHRAIQNEQVLKRQLSATQQTTVALGGATGTGLFLASGLSVGVAGPAIIISYVIAIETCRHCGGQLRVLASIEDPLVIGRILEQLDQREEQSRFACRPRAPPQYELSLSILRDPAQEFTPRNRLSRLRRGLTPTTLATHRSGSLGYLQKKAFQMTFRERIIGFMRGTMFAQA